jgi:predicted dehydrogenase
MADLIRWGIISTGGIAAKFAEDINRLPDAELVAVGSRGAESANAFGQKYGIPHRHATYEALAADPDVDVVYIGSIHPAHHDNTLLCLNAGKAVLCEKPFAMNTRQAEEMVSLARQKNLFLMEAMWSRCFPAYERIRQIIDSGVLGEVRMLLADFGINPPHDAARRRLFEKDLGGGALLDVGIYPVSLSSFVFGQQPATITSQAHIGTLGVDDYFGAVFQYPGGALSVLAGAVKVESPHEAQILGSKGRLHLHANFWHPQKLTLYLEGKQPEEISVPYDGNGYQFEAIEVMRCLREGKLESERMPLDETLAIMKTMDTIRGQWGLTYDGD